MAVAYHGFSGPLTVEDRAWKSNLPQAFINAGYELGFDYVDINGAEQIGEAQLKLQGKIYYHQIDNVFSIHIRVG